ncbi:MAG: hypothetical protein WCX07_01145 [Dehalococcoidales bacterium]|jgi:hypothetical protein|nr:hypothetical protein [Dehalococcoidales bacterium]
MKVLSIIFTTTGVLCLIMAVFTAVGIAPAFITAFWELSDMIITTGFWFFTSLVLVISGNAYGIVSGEH